MEAALLTGLPMIAGFHAELRMLLAAMVAMATVMPEPIRHSHPGGEQSHSHDADGHVHHSANGLASANVAEAEHHDHGIGRHSHGVDHGLCGSESHVLTAAASHWHYSWFGFNVTLPDPTAGHEREQDDRDFAPWIGVSSNDNISLARTQASPSEFLSLDADWPDMAVPTLCIIIGAAPPQRSAAPLCDSARHERSGVQLI
jgi:hypothetical protein